MASLIACSGVNPHRNYITYPASVSINHLPML